MKRNESQSVYRLSPFEIICDKKLEKEVPMFLFDSLIYSYLKRNYPSFLKFLVSICFVFSEYLIGVNYRTDLQLAFVVNKEYNLHA